MVRKHRDQAEQNKFSDNKQKWPGISAIIVDPTRAITGFTSLNFPVEIRGY